MMFYSQGWFFSQQCSGNVQIAHFILLRVNHKTQNNCTALLSASLILQNSQFREAASAQRSSTRRRWMRTTVQCLPRPSVSTPHQQHDSIDMARIHSPQPPTHLSIRIYKTITIKNNPVITPKSYHISSKRHPYRSVSSIANQTFLCSIRNSDS
jgi:hypothetical protein